MPRNALTVAAAVAYVVASCMIVGALGRAHREDLKRVPPSAEVAATIDPPITSPAPTPPSEPSRHETPVVMVRAPDPVPPPQPPPPTTVPAPAAVVATNPEPASAPTPKPGLRGPQELEVLDRLDPFFSTAAAREKWDLRNFDAEAEKRLGDQLNRLVMLPKLNRRYWNEAMQSRLEEAAAPILDARTRKDLNYRFHVLDDPMFNAFSHPGGHVYVTRGLMDGISEDQDYALRFLLAHEICHVDEGHAIRCLRDPALDALPYGTVPMFFLLIFPGGYGTKFEEQADDWAFRQMQRLQMSRHETLSFLSILTRYAERNGFPLGVESIDRSAPIPLFDLHIRTHPPARDRLKRLKDRLDQAVKKAG